MICLEKLPDTFYVAYEYDFEIGDQFLNVALMHKGDLPVVGQYPKPQEWYYYFRAICAQKIQTGVIKWDQENGPLTYKMASQILAALWNGEELAVVNNAHIA